MKIKTRGLILCAFFGVLTAQLHPLAQPSPAKAKGREPAPFRPAGPLPRLRVSDNQRFFVTEDGRPFFWLGDPAWLLFQ